MTFEKKLYTIKKKHIFETFAFRINEMGKKWAKYVSKYGIYETQWKKEIQLKNNNNSKSSV